jgi:aminopeptidase N
VTTEDFVRAMRKQWLRSRQFRRWYSQAGTPVLTVTTNSKTAARVSIARCPATPGQPNKAPFHIPVAIGPLDRNAELSAERVAGGSTAVESQRASKSARRRHIDRPRHRSNHRLSVTGLKDVRVERAARFLCAGESRVCAPSEELSFARYDTDGFSRWDAMQSLHADDRTLRGAADAAPLLPLYRELLSDAGPRTIRNVP